MFVFIFVLSLVLFSYVSFSCLFGLSQPHAVASNFLQHNCFDSSTVISLFKSLFSVNASRFTQSHVRSVCCALILAGACVASATTCCFQCFPVVALGDQLHSMVKKKNRIRLHPAGVWVLRTILWWRLRLFCTCFVFFFHTFDQFGATKYGWIHASAFYCELTAQPQLFILFFFIDSMLVLKWPSTASTACFR